jgi:RNA polymerase sigma-70 factor (ECF subfamily)
MGHTMTADNDPSEAKVSRALDGDRAALAELFERHRLRLRQMIGLRLDIRIRGRVDPSDVLQEVYIDVQRRFPEYAADQKVPLFLWMRQIVGQRLIDTHREHLGAQMRDARLEISLNAGAFPQATSESLAARLLGKYTTASRALERAENQRLVHEALNALEPIDREILAMRHFEMLSNAECAQTLGITKTTASNRYIRALKRVKSLLTFPRGS